MAQVDIGKIKIVWKGPWNSGTAYTVDDAVSHSGSSYICIQAGTNQNPSTATAYWQQMAGKGTDADLINISGTAQGDIYYNNGSAIARLAAGTSGQVLQTGGSGANPSWGTVSSDFVKIAEFNHSGSTVGYVDVDNVFSATYDIYKVYIENVLFASIGYNLDMRLLTAGGVSSASEYHHAEWGYTAGNASISGYSSGDSRWMIGQDQSSDSQRTGVSEITFYRPTSTTKYKNASWHTSYWCNNTGGGFRALVGGGTWTVNGTALTGFRMQPQSASNQMTELNGAVYGIKP